MKPRADAATGLPGKEAFFDEAAAYLGHLGACDVSIVCFDAGHFKLSNDLYGLDCGDELLRCPCRALALRFSPDGAQPLARLAADTFALCATDIRPERVERILVDISSECPNGIDAIVRAVVCRIEDPASQISIMCDRVVIALRAVKDINVDVLKIGMRFLDRDDRRSKGIMESIIRIPRWLDLPVIVEGVETREQVNFLLGVGCSYAQGCYYARPMEAAAFEALLTDGSKVLHGQCTLQDARRSILDFRNLLHGNTISDRMLSSIIGSVALCSYADGDLRLIRGNEVYRRLVAALGKGVNGAGRAPYGNERLPLA